MIKSSFADLKGKTVVITGGSGTLGSAMAKGLVQAGAKLGIMSRKQEKAQEVVETLLAEGGEAISLVADVLEKESLVKARERMLEQWGSIDVLINCAGGNKRGASIGPEQSIFDLSITDFDQVTALNLKGTLLPTLVFAEAMVQQETGVILNISSMAAQRPLTRVLAYSAAKAALDNLTKWLAVEMATKYSPNIRVNAIAPGFFIAEQNRHLLLQADGTLTERGQKVIDHTPMKRFGQPEELSGVVNWLCSDAASFVTGTVVAIDGGFSAFAGV
ncbi:MAG: SDR family oxidoreductase [Bacteroidota bacterium]